MPRLLAFALMILRGAAGYSSWEECNPNSNSSCSANNETCVAHAGSGLCVTANTVPDVTDGVVVSNSPMNNTHSYLWTYLTQDDDITNRASNASSASWAPEVQYRLDVNEGATVTVTTCATVVEEYPWSYLDYHGIRTTLQSVGGANIPESSPWKHYGSYFTDLQGRYDIVMDVEYLDRRPDDCLEWNHDGLGDGQYTLAVEPSDYCEFGATDCNNEIPYRVETTISGATLLAYEEDGNWRCPETSQILSDGAAGCPTAAPTAAPTPFPSPLNLWLVVIPVGVVALAGVGVWLAVWYCRRDPPASVTARLALSSVHKGH